MEARNIYRTEGSQLIRFNLVGAGGTGGRFAELLIRHLMQIDQHYKNSIAALEYLGSLLFEVNLYDHDTIEAKNLVRQEFIGVESLGLNKAIYTKMKLDRILGGSVMFSLDDEDNHVVDTHRVAGGINVSAYDIMVQEGTPLLPNKLEIRNIETKPPYTINISLVDNNSSRLALEKMYKKKGDTLRMALANSAAAGIMTALYDARLDRSLKKGEITAVVAMVAPYRTLENKLIILRLAVAKDNATKRIVGGYCVQLPDDIEYKSRKPKGVRGAHIDVGNSDHGFTLNAAQGVGLVDFRKSVYEKNMTVPDALLSCAEALEVTTVAQTATMNAAAAVAVMQVAARFLDNIIKVGYGDAGTENNGYAPVDTPDKEPAPAYKEELASDSVYRVGLFMPELNSQKVNKILVMTDSIYGLDKVVLTEEDLKGIEVPTGLVPTTLGSILEQENAVEELLNSYGAASILNGVNDGVILSHEDMETTKRVGVKSYLRDTFAILLTDQKS